jgi:hypothetical protein
MGLYIKPEYFQTVHYYFFCLGTFSLTTSFLFTAYNAYGYLFLAFYVANSAIAWYMSWFMHTRMKTVFVIRMGRYAASHIILTILSGGTSVFLYWIFALEFEAVMTAFIMVNFFVIFLGLMWYALGKFKVAEKFFDWQDRGKLETGREMVMRYRSKGGLRLVEDQEIMGYKWGSNADIDQLFMQVKMKSEKGNDFSDAVRDIEIKIGEIRIRELEGRIENLKKGQSMTDENLLQSYMGAVRSREKSMMEYEKEAVRVKASQNKAEG